MRPTERVADPARGAERALADDGQVTTDVAMTEEKSAVPAAALDKMLAMLGDLSKRLCRIESSQVDNGERQCKDCAESSVFSSVLGAGTVMTPRLCSRGLLPNVRRTSRRPPTLVPGGQLLLGMMLAHQFSPVATMECTWNPSLI